MERTQKLFETDVFRTQAVCTVVAVETQPKGGGRIALDATVFYPEGGGQPSDRGELIFADGTSLTVEEVHESSGIIWHSVSRWTETPCIGETVTARIDWAWRFDKMQQHTGEHILSGILHRMFGAENVGFHIGADAVRMDTDVPISAEGLREAETEANRVVWWNVPVVVSYPTAEELKTLTYRSKKEILGQVRIVSVEGADVCACCGTHVAFSGQVGMIKILTAENYKGGTRLSVVCGGRALNEIQAMRSRQAAIGALLSAKPSETANAVRRIYDELNAVKFAHLSLSFRLFDLLAERVAPTEDAFYTLEGLAPDALHRFAVRLTEKTCGLCVVLSPNDKGTGYCIARAEGDVRPLVKALNARFGGRGGGKPTVCQGSCPTTAKEMETFLRGYHADR